MTTIRTMHPSSCPGDGGGPAPCRAWAWGLCVGLALAAASGCTTLMPHQERRQQAQKNWEQVRAKVKRQLATQQFESGEIDAAITTVREALGLDPTCPESYLLLAQALLEKGDWAEAGRILSAAREMRLESPDLTYARGVVAERSDRIDEALRFYTLARQQDPTQMDYVVAEAECLVAAGRPEEARNLVRQSVDRFDRDGTLETLEAEISLSLGDRAAAAGAFRRALPLVSDSPLVAEEYGLLLADMGRFAEAVAVLQPLADAAGRTGAELSGAVVRALARSYLELGHTEAPTELLNGWLQQHPNDSTAWMLQAQAAMARDDEALARRCVAAIRRLAPGSAWTHLLCGYIQWRQGDTPGALKMLERSLTLQPNDTLLHCLIGQVLADANQIERARRHWQRALQIDPDVQWARNGLRGLESRSAG
ncbi:MAG TPA: tetratricopeptide repeat protein [Phycisphaerae bacterium]|nr:tetratricopeptide repeat protein [Phycisphaerae bacterium]